MPETQSPLRLVRFGPFEADLRTGELRKDSVKLKFSGQPFQVLAILLERPGDVVTREELQKRLWPDTFVDVERNLNTAINKIREVLGDSAESPRFIETLPRRGYRFIAPIESPLPELDQDPIEKPTDKPGKRGNRLNFRLAMPGGILLSAGLLAFWIASTRIPGTPKVLRFTRLTNDGQTKFGPLVTDGVRVYFNEWLPDGQNIIAQVSVKGGETTPLPVSLKSPAVLDLSRDGTELLVASDRERGIEYIFTGNPIWVLPVAGGSPIRVGTILAADAAFGPDGASMVYSQGHDVYSANRDGSSMRKLLTVENSPVYFRFSPDGKVLRFSQRDIRGDTGMMRNAAAIMSAAADGTGLGKMFPGCCGNWTPDGRFFIFPATKLDQTGGHLEVWALPEAKGFSWRKQNSEPIQLTSGPFEFWDPLPGKDGKGIFAIAWSPRAEVVRYDSKSHDFVPYLSGISAEGLAFSRDGKWVAYTSYPDGVLWRSRTDGSERQQLTSPPMRAFMPRWSPDSRQIAFNAIAPMTGWNIYLISSGGGSAERLLPSEDSQTDVDWSPDGKSLAFGSVDPNRSIYILDLSSRQVATLPGSKGFFSPHWSPDGRYISGTIFASDQLMLFDVSSQKWTKPCDCKVGYPMWSGDGKYLYFEYFLASDKPALIGRLRLSDHKIEEIADIALVGRDLAGTFGSWVGITPDESPLVARDISTHEIYALEMQWP